MSEWKRCFKCDELKPLREYYRHPRMADGHLNKCRVCTRKDVQDNRAARRDYYKEYDRARSQLPHRKALVRAMEHKHRARHLARIAVHNAVVRGKLKRSPCEVCGDPKVDAHHEDYGKPLDVVWLCRIHHGMRHRMDDAA